jgi:hypothetical protein
VTAAVETRLREVAQDEQCSCQQRVSEIRPTEIYIREPYACTIGTREDGIGQVDASEPLVA